MQTAGETQAGNRLADATSPYLLQHAHNPVDWYPWGPEAFARARDENKPIFLSVGYSACHWCHVMERESFENPHTARLMNEHFINIKVDREERPDIDELYMLVTQLTTGGGGWPMSVFLLADLRPFYAGTYFPPHDSFGRPGFQKVLTALATAWKTREADVRQQAQQIVEAVQAHVLAGAQRGHGQVQTAAWMSAAIDDFRDRFDPQMGGLGTAPKFPPSQALLFWLLLLDAAEGRPPVASSHAPATAPAAAVVALPEASRQLLREMVQKTLDCMAAGGICDQVAGGFARYSVDANWLVPHFEKMLYDNAQLALVYALAAVHFQRKDYERVARRTLEFFLDEMANAGGGFFTALDADSEGHEGKYYVWTLEELQAACANPADAALAIEHFGVTALGNWEDVNVLHVARGAADLAVEHRCTPQAMQARIDAISQRLRAARARRVRPALDDKVLIGWNGLMISALAVAGRLLAEPRYLEAAHRAMGYILITHRGPGGRLLRSSRNGIAQGPAFLEDYAFLLNGLLDLIDSTSPTSLAGTMARRRAVDLADDMVALYGDADGGFFFTPKGQEPLFAAVKTISDNAIPGANAMAIRALLRLGRLSGMQKYHELAMRSIAYFAGTIDRFPAQCCTVLSALAEDLLASALPPAADELAAGDAVAEPIAIPAGEARGLSSKAPAEEADSSAGDTLALRALPLTAVRPGERLTLRLQLEIREGYFIHPKAPEDPEMFATVARLIHETPLNAGDLVFPPPDTFSLGGQEITGYRNSVPITCEIAVPTGTPAGQYPVRAVVLAQPCNNEFCLPPQRVGLDVQISVAPT